MRAPIRLTRETEVVRPPAPAPSGLELRDAPAAPGSVLRIDAPPDPALRPIVGGLAACAAAAALLILARSQLKER
jgi:hypothetical protein